MLASRGRTDFDDEDEEARAIVGALVEVDLTAAIKAVLKALAAPK